MNHVDKCRGPVPSGQGVGGQSHVGQHAARLRLLGDAEGTRTPPNYRRYSRRHRKQRRLGAASQRCRVTRSVVSLPEG